MSFTNKQTKIKGIFFFGLLLVMLLLPVIFPNPARLGMFMLANSHRSGQWLATNSKDWIF